MAAPALSARLELVCQSLGPGPLLVDVGTDHALLPLAWLARHPTGRAIGIDRAKAPLARAKEHRAHSAAASRLELWLQDGLGDGCLEPAPLVSICGMGGRSIAKILRHSTAVQQHRVQRLVLGPNDHAKALRIALFELGYGLSDEQACWDRAQYYPLLIATPAAPGPPLPEAALRFGPHLLTRAHPALARWLAAQHRRLSRIEQARAPALLTPAQRHTLDLIGESWIQHFLTPYGEIEACRD